jgi:tetratricopeptide (TPR) repeat protein
MLAVTAVLVLFAAQDLPPGYQHFYNLDFGPALAEFERQAAANPNDPEAQNHIAHTILYAEMFRNGALESEMVSGTNAFLRREGLQPSKADQARFAAAIDKSVRLCEDRIRRNEKDKDAYYALGVAYGLKANYDFLVNKAWSDALSAAGKARKQHEKVTEIDPEFVDAYLTQGIHQYVVGSLPKTVRFFGFFIGFRGDRAKGIELLRKVEIYGQRNRIDAEIMLAAIYRREKKPEYAIPLLAVLSQRFPRNFLLQFELVQMHADLGDKAKCLAILDQIEANRAARRDGYERVSRERIAYARGNLLFWYQDLAPALASLKTAVADVSQLNLGTGQLAWMRLGQVHDMRNERKEAVIAYEKAIALAPKSEVAKECKGYKSKPYRRT